MMQHQNKFIYWLIFAFIVVILLVYILVLYLLFFFFVVSLYPLLFYYYDNQNFCWLGTHLYSIRYPKTNNHTNVLAWTQSHAYMNIYELNTHDWIYHTVCMWFDFINIIKVIPIYIWDGLVFVVIYMCLWLGAEIFQEKEWN